MNILSKEANAMANKIIISCLVAILLSIVCYVTGENKYKQKYENRTREYNEIYKKYKTLEINYQDAIYDCRGGETNVK